jgi:ribosomal protein L11 methyltransferase
VVVATGPAAEAELVADALLLAGASAVAEEALGDGRLRLTADPRERPQLPAGWQLEVQEVPAGAGLDEWRAHARPHRVGARIVLQPPWVDATPVGPGDVVVLLDPGHAFGSGSHPTTRLALTAIEQTVRGGERVLDVGCGSGVLAVTALLLGAGAAVGTDLDPAALTAASQVARANGVGRRLEVVASPTAEVPGRYDLVVANISAATLLELAPVLADRVLPGGRVVLTGFLEERAHDVRAAFPDLHATGHEVEEGWAALVLTC